MSTTAKPDTHEMVVIHRVFRREFHLLPDLISRVGPGDTGRAAIVGEHLTDIVASLHHHHENEDDLLWPPLLERNLLAHLPAPVKLLWRFVGRRQYDNYIRRVRGTA